MQEMSQDQPMLCSSVDLGAPSMTTSGRKLRINVLGNGDQINPDAPIADVRVAFNNARPRQITSAVIGAATERAPAGRTPSLVLKTDSPDFALLANALQARAKDQLALQTERLGCCQFQRHLVEVEDETGNSPHAASPAHHPNCRVISWEQLL